MTATDIRSTFPAWTPVLLYDASYAKLQLAYLLDEYYPWFRRWLEGMGLGAWDRRWDCDDFALMFVAGMKIAHRKTAGVSSESPAVGVFCYHSPGGPHAIVVAYTDHGQVFIEPQTGKQLDLTSTQVSSCFAASF